jgi:hypothetical protein
MTARPLVQNQKNSSSYIRLEIFLINRLIQVKFKAEIMTLRKTEASVPQGNVLGPLLYLSTQVISRHQTTQQLLPSLMIQQS